MGDGIEYGSCTNIDECASDTTSGCLFGATCIEADDGYFCQCQDGYEGNEEGSFGCVEINECGSPELNNCNTNANCINTPGSYTCKSKTGYSSTRLVCDNVDECLERSDDCDENASCIDQEPK